MTIFIGIYAAHGLDPNCSNTGDVPGEDDRNLACAHALSKLVKDAGYAPVMIRPGRGAVCVRAIEARMRVCAHTITIHIHDDESVDIHAQRLFDGFYSNQSSGC